MEQEGKDMKSNVEGMLTLYLYILDDLEEIGVFTDEEAQAIADVVHGAEERHREKFKQMFETNLVQWSEKKD